VAADLSETFKEDFEFCLKSGQEFARRQRDMLTEFDAEIAPGIMVGQKQIPVGSAGCYLPGGRYPLVSAAIMSPGTPKVAGVAQEAIAVSDKYAPEHLEPRSAHDDDFLAGPRNYGSVFIGGESTVAYGDNGVGTNRGTVRYTGGLWGSKFIKTVTYQRLTPVASQRIGGTMGRMRRVEGMIAHALTGEARVDRYARQLGAAADRSEGRRA